jgi:trimeric autotransporter adhesin
MNARTTALAAGLAGLVMALLGTVATTPAEARTGVAPSAAPPPSALGTAARYAAGSCWEVKQQRPSAPSGVYWLLTPAMAEPQQLYCDQTTDGGGWVLVGKGRNGWTADDSGRGSAAALKNLGYAGGADTHQYSAALINQLLDGGRVADLTDGVRVRRALTTAGSSWQEVRFEPDTRQTGWSWAFEARFDVGSWSFTSGSGPGTGPTSGSGGVTTDFGTGSSWSRVHTGPSAATDWTSGFGYGDAVTGSSATGSALWSSESGARAIPVAQVFLRPRVSSDDADFDPVPSTGTARRVVRALPRSDADVLPWGVSGMAGSTAREGSVEVQELLEAHGRMYVGGNFRYVQRDGAGTGRVAQPFLAAFDLVTGAWVSSFRPVLNEQVRTLELSSTGAIIAGGDFAAANGAKATGLVALNPDTGATDTSFRVAIENRLTGGVVRVWALDRLGTNLYVGGDFTHLKGGPSTGFTYMRGLARVRLTDGRTQAGWNPEMNGPVIAIDASSDATRIYAAGHFTTSRDVPARSAAAVLTTFVRRSDGTIRHLADPAWAPVWSSTNNYQQAVVETSGHVWVGGSEHSLFGFDRGTFARTSTTILHGKGDIQAVATKGTVVYAGSHANNQYAYTGATTWSGSGPEGPWTSAHTQHWIGAYDSSSGAALADFAPSMASRTGSGIWAATVDSRGRLWVGGDITRAGTGGGSSAFAGGFARFAPRDATAPATPGSFRVASSDADSVTLAWGAVSDPSGVRYQVLRDDRPIATTTQDRITIPVDQGDVGRYFVRAADGSGNISASTAVLNAGTAGEATLVPADAVWTWRFAAGSPGTGWKTLAFDDSTWHQTGTAPLGFAPAGDEGQFTTDIDRFASASQRPLAAYFRREFQVADPSDVQQLVVRGVADDGAVFYLNGVELGRQNMPSGTVSYQTYATSSRRLSVAQADPIVLQVPPGRLVAGTNIVTAETHLNFRATVDVTFWMSVEAVLG